MWVGAKPLVAKPPNVFYVFAFWQAFLTSS
jgi:hypothetical protein